MMLNVVYRIHRSYYPIVSDNGLPLEQVPHQLVPLPVAGPDEGGVLGEDQVEAAAAEAQGDVGQVGVQEPHQQPLARGHRDRPQDLRLEPVGEHHPRCWLR